MYMYARSQTEAHFDQKKQCIAVFFFVLNS